MMIDRAGTYFFAGRHVKRLGYGAMQLAGPGVFGPPRDHDAALAVLRTRSRPASTTSTPATSTARTLPTG